MDLEPRGGVEETEVGPGDGEEEGRVMCTIKGVGNKSLNHMNSLPTLNSKVFPPFSQYCSYLTSVQVPKYGVLTAYEDELGQYLDNIKIWGIDVFKISEFSNNRPLTAVTYRVFQVRDSRITLDLIIF